MNTQMKRYIRQGLEGFLVQELLSLWSWGAPPSLHVDVFTSSEFLQRFMFKSFYRAQSPASQDSQMSHFAVKSVLSVQNLVT